jgi:hypothetical protein
VSADPPDFFQAPNAPNTSEARLERLERLSELAQRTLMSLAIEIIEAKATATSSDPLKFGDNVPASIAGGTSSYRTDHQDHHKGAPGGRRRSPETTGKLGG